MVHGERRVQPRFNRVVAATALCGAAALTASCSLGAAEAHPREAPAPTVADGTGADVFNSNTFADDVPDYSGKYCPAGSVAAGKATGYHDGKKQKINLCYYNGALLRDKYMQDYMDLTELAYSKGIVLKAIESFRTMKDQRYFYNCYMTQSCNSGSPADKPGESEHQDAGAVDLQQLEKGGEWQSLCDPAVVGKSCDGRGWEFMQKFAPKYGFHNTIVPDGQRGEWWHWSRTGS